MPPNSGPNSYFLTAIVPDQRHFPVSIHPRYLGGFRLNERAGRLARFGAVRSRVLGADGRYAASVRRTLCDYTGRARAKPEQSDPSVLPPSGDGLLRLILVRRSTSHWTSTKATRCGCGSSTGASDSPTTSPSTGCSTNHPPATRLGCWRWRFRRCGTCGIGRVVLGRVR